jgi:hypothetical protein
MKRVGVDIEVLGGSFAAQPLVFAHLVDEVPGIDLDHVEVICGADPRKRLGHYFAPDLIDQIEDALGLHDTCVLILPGAGGPLGRTGRLVRVGRWAGTRAVPG